MEACLVALKAEGIEKVILFVKADNAAGKEFWKKRRLGASAADIVTDVHRDGR